MFLTFGDTRVPAQIDTGYGDFAGSQSIDINWPLFDLLERTAALVQTGTVSIKTCSGTTESRPVFRGPSPLAMTDEAGVTVASLTNARLILKSRNACGGIASMAEPAAQLAISSIATLGTLVFDPLAARVWVKARP